MAKAAVSEIQRMYDLESTIARMDGVLESWDDSVAYDGIKKLRASRDLLGVLHAADVRPFETESVERYKQRFQDRFNLRQELRMWQNWVGIVLMAGVFLGGLCGLFGWLLSWKLTVGGVIAAFASFVTIVNLPESIVETEVLRGSWKRHWLSAYANPIPIDVLSIISRVRSVNSKVTFEVDEFATEVVHDPFLVAKLGAQEYYIAVWDEPTFDASARL